MKIAALVLAAGKSSRMGFNKLLANVGGASLIARTVENIAASKVDHVIVVTGHDDDLVRQALDGCDVEFVYNPEFATGLASSVKAGIAQAHGNDGALVCLGDMPLVSPDVINKMIAAFDPSAGRSLIYPLQGGNIGNPVLWGAHYFPELLALQGDRGARALISRHSEMAVAIDVGDEGIHLDADTPEALARLRSIAGF